MKSKIKKKTNNKKKNATNQWKILGKRVIVKIKVEK